MCLHQDCPDGYGWEPPEDAINIKVVSEWEEDEEHDPFPAQLLKWLIETGRGGRFAQALVDRYPVWHSICLLEDDMLASAMRNRWAFDVSEWHIVLGYCDDLEPLPDYTGRQKYVAWVETEDWVIVIPPSYAPHEDDIEMYTREDFDLKRAALPLVKVAFADDSGIKLSEEFRVWHELEAQYRAPTTEPERRS